MSSLTCAMDVHTVWTDLTIRRNLDGEIVGGYRKLPNEKILDFLRENPGISRIAMEASTSAIPLYRQLKDAGYEDVLVSHPKKTRLIAESLIKTDRVDSEALSELARLNALPLAWIPDKETARLREKVRRRAYLVRMRTRMKNKIRMQLLYEGLKKPEFGVFTKKGVEWLHSLGLDSIESYLPVMSVLSEQVEKLSKELRQTAPADEDAKLLMTIPGIGYYSALLIKSEVGRIDRFPDGEHLCSYAGLVTSVSQTGKSRRYGPITNRVRTGSGGSW